jgi:hypothetical protein
MRLSDLWSDARLGPILKKMPPAGNSNTPMRGQTSEALHTATVRALANRLAGCGFALFIATATCAAGVLSPTDLKKVEDLRPMFAGLMGDLDQTSRRTDISGVDAECIKSTIQDLIEISQELSSYEYLITIEKDLTDFGENSPMRDVIKFAIDKSTSILASERKKLTQKPDQCARSPLAAAKNQLAIQVVDTTTGILGSIRSRF